MTDHHPRRAPRWAATLALIVTVLGAVPAGAQSLEEVTAKRQRIEAELDAAVAAYEELLSRIATTEQELATLSEQVAALEQEAAAADAALADRARALFKRGDGSMLGTVLSAEGPAGALERAQFIAALTVRDQARLEHATNRRVRLSQARALLEDTAAELADLEQQLAVRQRDLEQRLAVAKAQEQELRSRRERQRIIARGAQQGIYACIMEPPYHFRDTWGAPRSGGRRHKGTDVMAPYNAKVYAFTHGRISRISTSRLGGLGLYLWGDDGVEYYYAHLADIAPGIYVGKRVEAGEWVALNGNSGNARGGVPHVHFEVHPGGGAPVNPYPWLAAVC